MATTTLLSRFFITLSAAAITSVFHFTTTSVFRPNVIVQDNKNNLEGVSRSSLLSSSSASLSSSSDDPLRGLITNLPGLDYDPGFNQYSGYLQVSEAHGRNIFYWYVESQNNPATDPLVLWTNGGPGCSGLIGLLREHGPFLLDSQLQMSPNPYSWNKMANVLYIEQPAFVGFSYSESPSDYYTGDEKAATDNMELIRLFLQRFPERQWNNFYIASESYGGHYMPQLALQILQNNTDHFIRFKGVLIGNPFVDPFSNAQAEIGSYYSHGLLPGPLYQQWTTQCSTRETFDTSECEELAEDIFAKAGEGINPYALDYPVCNAQLAAERDSPSSKSTNHQVSSAITPNVDTSLLATTTSHHRHLISSQVHQLYYEKRQDRHNHHKNSPPFIPAQDHYQPCSEYHAIQYLNQHNVRKALHVNNHWSSEKWSTCNLHIKYSPRDMETDVIPLYRELLAKALSNEHDLNIMIYSGDDDSVCATAGTQTWLWGLGVSAVSSNWTWTPWKVNHQTAGYVTKFNVGLGGAQFTFVTVHGAGHEVPAYRPREALAMFQNYFNGTW